MAAESYARGATEPALIEQTIGDFFDAMVAWVRWWRTRLVRAPA